MVKARSARVRRCNNQNQSGKGAGAQLGHRDIHGVDSGVEVPMAGPIAGVHPVLRDGGILCAADLIGLGVGEDLVNEALEHLAHEIWGCLGEQFVKVGRRVDRIGASGHL
ncbi:Uncharacterised protein [Corynebacterium diphtheriae]|nr:Uncharacterised protein [Corynebacterium diphtheriae]